MALAGSATAKKGWITTLSPALRVSGVGPRAQAFVDFRHDESYYSGLSSSNTGRNLLSSYGTLETVDNWMYVDAAASVAPRSKSVFSNNTTNSSNAVGNQDEMRAVRVSPNIRGQLFGNTDYMMRITRNDVRLASDTFSWHTRADQLAGSLRKPAGQGAIGWFADGNGVRVDSSTVGERRDDRMRGGVILPTVPHLHVLAFTGRERTDFASTTTESFSTPGFGFEWRPSERTQAIGMREKRFFGVSHDVSVSHRTPFTAWRYSDVKDAAALPTGLAGFHRGSVYDLMADLLTVSITDPVARDRAARARADQVGGPAGAGVDATGVLVSRVFLDRTRQASVALLGTRNIVTLILHQRDQQLLENGATFIQDDFALSSDIRDRGGFVSWIHRLTPVVDLNLSVTYGKRYALNVPDLEATERSGMAALNYWLSPNARGSLAVRATNFSNLGGDLAVHERALVGTLMQRF
jgi:uncharacterized protein (PEP-CTERM system associated)